MKLTFWGAAGTVTGSMHLLESGGKRYLLDCGLFQGRRKDADLKNRKLPFPGASIDAVVLSHAHIDHSGNLPTLVKNGFAGPIYSTPASVDLCNWMLRDTAHIQEKDAEFLNKRAEKRRVAGNARKEDANGPVEPLYTTADAERTIPLFQGVPYHEPFHLSGTLSYEAYDAGHILGSSCIVLNEKSSGAPLRLTFSGDVGRPNLPIIRDPEKMPPTDYLIMESTYGDRLHAPIGDVKAKLAGLVKDVLARGGHMIVPAFAVERTQQLVLLLHEMIEAKEIPEFPIYVDSPLASAVTEVFKKHTEEWDEGATAFFNRGVDAFGWNRLRYTQTVQESKALNDLHVPYMVMSASGMCEAGRILHHLKNGIEDPRNLILITGYQAPNTLGSKLVAKQPEVNIFGEPMRVRAQVESIDSLSGHADQQELLDWMAPVAPTLKKVFLVHGELDAMQALKAKIVERYKLEVVFPKRGDRFEVS
jgi:metallo-beta-lactamase family protein